MRLNIDLTGYCNYSCKMCGIQNNKLLNKKQIEKRKRYIKEFKELYGTDNIVVVSGGEPLYNQHIIDFYKFLNNERLNSMMITNGVFLKDKFEYINFIDKLVIGLDGFRETYKYIRNTTDKAYNKVIEGIEYSMKKIKRPLISINCTLQKSNIDEFSEFVDYYKNKVDKITVNVIQEWGGLSNFDNSFKTKTEKKKFESILKNNEKYIDGNIYRYIEYVYNKKKAIKHNICNFKDNNITIGYKNCLLPCLGKYKELGINPVSIKNNSIKKTLNSDEYKNMRKRIKNCDLACGVNCSVN